MLIIHVTSGPIVKEREVAFMSGGFVHLLFSLANLASDYEISIVCPNPQKGKHEQTVNYERIAVLCLGSHRWTRWVPVGTPLFFKHAYEYIRKEKPDILIGDGVLASFFLRSFPQVPFKVGIIHHLFHTASVEGSSKHMIRWLGVLERLGLHLVKLDKIAVVNPMVKETLMREGFRQEDVVFVGNGVYVDKYPFSANKMQHTLIYIGRLVGLKRVSSLVQIVSLLKKKFPGVMLHIVGDGPKREEIKKALVNRGYSKDEGQGGRHLSNVSQLITTHRPYWKEIIRYDSIGNTKENYQINTRYLNLIKKITEEISL